MGPPRGSTRRIIGVVGCNRAGVDQLLAVGNNTQIQDYRGEETIVHDLGGRMVMPGIHDTHAHPTVGGIWANFDCMFATNDVDEVLETLKIFFANVPYELHLKNEKYYQTIFFTIFELLGYRVAAEVSTNRRRIDAVVEMEERVYIFGFKLFGTKTEALAQIKQQKYYAPYLKRGKEIILVGVAFSQTERNIDDWVVKSV